MHKLDFPPTFAAVVKELQRVQADIATVVLDQPFLFTAHPDVIAVSVHLCFIVLKPRAACWHIMKIGRFADCIQLDSRVCPLFFYGLG